jgi:probable O-glycosylation ligase (exosortase A-associated)
MGLALIMVIPLMRYLQLQAKNFWIGQALTVSMLLTCIAAIGSQSRGALVGMAVMAAFLALKSRNKVFMLLLIIVVVGSVVTIMPQEWHDRMSTIKDYEQDSSALGRLDAWSTAISVAKYRVTGGGFETFKPGLYYMYGADAKHLSSTDAHSIYFEVMGEHGFIGFSLFMLLAWFAWNTGSRIRRQAGRSEETRWCADLASMLQVSLMGYAAAGAFLGLAYFDLYYNLIAMMVICRVLLQEQIFQMEAAADPQEPGVTVAAEQQANSDIQ